mmetsp:Transcript_23134/g.32670  ORF Transcript_23134/g.32670 Transcript_23134/m.32670 type:complete len:248 (-) Transcript_23134:300-1043(-)
MSLIDTTNREYGPAPGRRAHVDQSHYIGDDWLKGGVCKQQEIGVSCSRNAKFAQGFFRRRADHIQPMQERMKYEHEKAVRRELQHQKRNEFLTTAFTRHGNVINCSDARDDPRPARKPVRQVVDEARNRSRQINGFERFHAVDTPASVAGRERRIEAARKRNFQHSSVLGFGRKDLPSYGVWDNFSQPMGLSSHTDSPVKTSHLMNSRNGDIISHSHSPVNRDRQPMLSKNSSRSSLGQHGANAVYS